ncbi:2-succinylbenzoate--CoA ligase [Opitutus terrae]|uniref:O-succinylbenzoic acid--CoA ligase n=1 Tax=Opitutus terrae (strain DSM 11246 / JCM 15787 / PB90-1) TaxID=452637 RepID=B1ZW05_OPITP|nr:2-succinylbenzoate--CoA ligase [Opitutus terrae]ACB76088.1 O-succinylbenzoic acid--CoA ligase [Opitutus terrae PB90-1]
MTRADVLSLLRATGCAQETGGTVFLSDPRWSKAERAQVEAARSNAAGRMSENEPDGWICLPTGGTSGAIRFARHDEQTLLAAVDGFVRHFQLTRVNAVDVLPPFHVSGLMARLRSAATGGTHVAWDWKRLEGGERPELSASAGEWVLSLVPTQLQRLLGNAAAVEWLRAFAIVFLGGGPVWPALADQAARAGIRVSLSYGMTETAAMVTALLPDEFLAGGRSVGRALPHARLELSAAGVIRIAGASVFRGYYPAHLASREFETSDLGEIAADGRLTVLGRHDAVIISGGEKVNPVEVEAVLRATGAFEDVAVLGVPDEEWGERIVACYPAVTVPDLGYVGRKVAEQLAGFRRPKAYVAVADWPRNAQGKLNRVLLQKAVVAQRSTD